MEDLAALLQTVKAIMSIEFSVFGIGVSFWGICMYTLAAGIVIWLIRGFLD